MPIESATYLADLNASYPAAGDPVGQGDDHTRLIKSTVKATFPNFTSAALSATQANLDAAVANAVTGPFVTPTAGTITNPGVAFSGDANTGIRSSAADKMRAVAGGADIAEVSSGGLEVLVGDVDVTSGSYLRGGVDMFPLQSADIDTGAVATSNIASSAVTYAKIQNVANGKLLGNFSGGSAAPSEYSLGAGLTTSGSSIVTAFAPVVSAFKNLVIKVTGNTAATVTADWVVISDGTNYKTVAVSETLSTGSTGANGLESGVASSTWYSVWVIGKTDGTVDVFASTSATSPTLPSGYTYQARIGWLRTDNVSQLMGTWQFGRLAYYKVGLAKTSVLPQMDTGLVGDLSVPTWESVSVSNYVPTSTASIILGTIYLDITSGSARAMAAPSNSYGGFNDPTNPPPYCVAVAGGGSNVGGSLPFDMQLESTNIYWASSRSGDRLLCRGWEDNI